jgi:hypothetical protein
MLLLYTDVVTGSIIIGKHFVEERYLIRDTEDHGCEPPENPARESLRSVRAFTGSEQQWRDIAIVRFVPGTFGKSVILMIYRKIIRRIIDDAHT